jgi:hypothetical protein
MGPIPSGSRCRGHRKGHCRATPAEPRRASRLSGRSSSTPIRTVGVSSPAACEGKREWQRLQEQARQHQHELEQQEEAGTLGGKAACRQPPLRRETALVKSRLTGAQAATMTHVGVASGKAPPCPQHPASPDPSATARSHLVPSGVSQQRANAVKTSSSSASAGRSPASESFAKPGWSSGLSAQGR